MFQMSISQKKNSNQPPPQTAENCQTTSLSQIIEHVNKELTEVARRTEPSVLRDRTYHGMSEEKWMDVVKTEIQTRCPIIFHILSSILNYNINQNTAIMCLIYGIIMFTRCQELSRIQRINSVLLIQGQASTTVSPALFDTHLWG